MLLRVTLAKSTVCPPKNSRSTTDLPRICVESARHRTRWHGCLDRLLAQNRSLAPINAGRIGCDGRESPAQDSASNTADHKHNDRTPQNRDRIVLRKQTRRDRDRE